jgi:fatty acid desaturase
VTVVSQAWGTRADDLLEPSHGGEPHGFGTVEPHPKAGSMTTVTSTLTRTTSATSLYSEILAQAKAAGLLTKTPGFYVGRLIAVTVINVALWSGLVLLATLASGWWVAPAAGVVAVLLGVMSAQYGFIAHEAAHRQVFSSNRLNDAAGLVLANGLAGLSYGFWLKKHNRHHAKPNQVGADPDIDIRVLSFTTESLEAKSGIERAVSRRQGWLFPILLCFTGFDLLLDSLVSVTRKDARHPGRRVVEFALMLVRQVTPFVVFWALFGPWVAVGLWTVMMMAFGLFMGGAFAPNHKGMPLVPREAKLDFFTRQVLTSRNIRPGWWADNLMGGLNYQVEHHLFPSMPRPHLRAAHQMVVAFCAEREVPLTEMSLAGSYRAIIEHLNKVGLSSNADPFVCPMVAELRPRF